MGGTIQADSITDSAGTGAPSFPFGLKNPAPSYYSGYFPGSSSNYWTTTSTSYVDATPQGSIPAITELASSGFGSVTGAGSSLPGVAFTAQKTGVVKVRAQVLLGATNSTLGGLRLIEAGGTLLSSEIVAGSSNQMVYTLEGYMSVTAGVSYTFKIQGKIASSAITFSNIAGSTDAGLTVQMQYV